MDLLNLHKNLSSLDVVEIAVSVFEDLEKFILDLNREQMAKEGIRPDGSQIEPEYKDITKIIKSDKPGISGIIEHVTLYDTGDFHKSLFLEVFPDELIIEASDSKAGALVDKYGEVLGLTEDNIKKLKDKFLPEFWKRVEAHIIGT